MRFIWIIRRALLLQPRIEANMLAWPGLAWLGLAWRWGNQKQTSWQKVNYLTPCLLLLFWFRGTFFWEQFLFLSFFFLAVFTMSDSSVFTTAGSSVFSDPLCSLIHFFSVITRYCLHRADWHLCHAELILGGLQPLHTVIVFVSLNETLKPLNPMCGPSGTLT